MKIIKLFFFALCIAFAYSISLVAAVVPNQLEFDDDSVWVAGEALITEASQITANNTQSGFPTSNLLRPESEGVGTNQYIWHTSWGNPPIPPANTDTYLQVQFKKPQSSFMFSMIGSTWIATSDTPKEVVIMAANDPKGEWTEVEHLTDMQFDFTAFSPERYTSPRIDLGAEYSYVRFVVKKTINEGNRSRYDANGNPFVSLGRFQVYSAVKGAPDPNEPKECVNLLFIGNSITYGAGLSNPAVEAPPAVCQSIIANATGIATNLYNGGHSGITTIGFLPGRDDFTRVVSAARALQKKRGAHTYFSIMLGTNDSACSGPEGAPVNVNDYKSNLKKIIDELIKQVPDCKILLNYPLWYSPNTHNAAKYLQEGLDRLRSYYPIIDEVVSEYDQVVAGNRGVWEYFENKQSLFIAENGNSGTFYLHPNAQGARHLAEIWSKSLMDMIAADSLVAKVSYRIEDADGKFLKEHSFVAQEGDTISELPDEVEHRAYTSYSVPEPVIVKKGEANIVRVVATWELPFELSPNLSDAKWYNLALREGADYVRSSEGYKCNTATTKEEAMTFPYQWAFQGDPYSGIIVYNRDDTTKTLANVNNKAILSQGVYSWNIEEAANGFLLANVENGKYINEYGGNGGYLGFYNNSADAGSIFMLSEVGSMPYRSVTLSSGASIKIFIASEEKSNGRAVLVIPGGGYAFVAGSNEGSDWVGFFNELGYTVGVLKYTTPPTSYTQPLTQARSAMSYMRENAEELRLSTKQIGVMGFSAGGHLAASVSSQTSGAEAPAFQILFYPVITMDATYTHTGSLKSLLGNNPPPKLVTLFSNEKQVKETTPMTYICWADDDNIVPVRNSTNYVKALNDKGVPVHTMNIPTGGHGYGYGINFEYHDQIISDLKGWMLSIDELLLTNIVIPVEEKLNDGKCYNLLGQPVSEPQKGIYIKNGVKLYGNK